MPHVGKVPLPAAQQQPVIPEAPAHAPPGLCAPSPPHRHPAAPPVTSRAGHAANVNHMSACGSQSAVLPPPIVLQGCMHTLPLLPTGRPPLSCSRTCTAVRAAPASALAELLITLPSLTSASMRSPSRTYLSCSSLVRGGWAARQEWEGVVHWLSRRSSWQRCCGHCNVLPLTAAQRHHQPAAPPACACLPPPANKRNGLGRRC